MKVLIPRNMGEKICCKGFFPQLSMSSHLFWAQLQAVTTNRYHQVRPCGVPQGSIGERDNGGQKLKAILFQTSILRCKLAVSFETNPFTRVPAMSSPKKVLQKTVFSPHLPFGKRFLSKQVMTKTAKNFMWGPCLDINCGARP